MFGGGHKSHRRGSNPLVTMFRLLLSISVLCLLLVVGYGAFKNFSGYDPLQINPSNLSGSLINNPKIYSIFTKLMSFDPTNSLQKIQSKVAPDASTIPDSTSAPKGELAFKFAIVTDSHNDNDDLAKALAQASSAGAKFAIHLGDFSNVGTVEELQAAKKVLDASGLPYYTTAGDHDLWDARNKKLDPITNYAQVFGSSYSSFGYGDYRFILLFNSDNYLGIDDTQLLWLSQELERVKDSKKIFILTSTPFYHPSSDHVYGKVDPKFKGQGQQIIDLFKKYHVAEIFAGDIHFYTSYVDPQSGIHMTTVGAVTSTRNAQSPRFALVDVYDSGDYTIEDTEIK